MVAALPREKCICVKKSSYNTADSWWSWLVLLCAFLSHVIITGSIASFGIFFPALLTEFNQDKAITVFVNSLCFLVAGVLASLNGKLIDRFGCRLILASCFMTCAVSYFTSSFATNVYVLFATYSVLIGYVLCSVCCTVMLAVASQFNKKRSLAIGIIAAGFGAGVLTMNPIIQLLLDQFGLRGAFRALAGMMAASSLLSSVVNTRTLTDNQETEVSVDVVGKDEKNHKTSNKGWREVLKSFYINGDLIVYTLSLAVVDGMGMWIPIIHMAKYAEGLGISSYKASQLYMAFGLSNVAGRIISGYIVNVQWSTPKRLYVSAAVLGMLVTALLPQATKYQYLLVANVVLGCIEGTVTSTIFVLQLQIIINNVPSHRQGHVFGVCNSVFFVVCASGPPIAGLIVDVFGSYAVAFYVASAIELCGTALISLIYCFNRPRKQLLYNHVLTPEGHCLVVVEKVSVL